jgi:hypothetical protein
VRFWRRSPRTDGRQGDAGAGSKLASIDESTPHHYSFWLAHATDRAAAMDLVGENRHIPRTYAVVGEPDGRVRFDMAVSGNGRGQSIISVLYSLERAGIGVAGFEATDVIDDATDADLATLVEAFAKTGNNGPTRSRMARLGGTRLLELFLERHLAAPATDHEWSAIIGDIAFNTPGSEGRLVRAAEELDRKPRGPGDTDYNVYSLLVSAENRARLADLGGLPIDLPEDVLIPLAERSASLGRVAVELIGLQSAPLSDDATKALGRLAQRGDERAAEALQALRKATPSPDVRATVDRALGAPSADVRAYALTILAHHWGTEARPTWREFLTSKSTTCRMTAESVLGDYGTEEDLDDAASTLGRIIRAKQTMSYSPPRGSELIELLVRFRDRPIAEAGLDDLSARWDRLADELRTWLVERHPWLDPARRTDRPVEQSIEPETPTEPAMPTIERIDDGFNVTFDDEAAWSDARERFEAAVAAHPSIDILEADREWMTLRVGVTGPEELIRTLWLASVADTRPQTGESVADE